LRFRQGIIQPRTFFQFHLVQRRFANEEAGGMAAARAGGINFKAIRAA